MIESGYNEGRLLANPCRVCGSQQKLVELAVHEHMPELTEYLTAKAYPAERDPTLPEGGVIRWDSGRRIGRDGRLVERTARYDPWHDVAEERVIDVESGEVIVDKIESMAEKYATGKKKWKRAKNAEPAPITVRQALRRFFSR